MRDTFHYLPETKVKNIPDDEFVMKHVFATENHIQFFIDSKEYRIKIPTNTSWEGVELKGDIKVKREIYYGKGKNEGKKYGKLIVIQPKENNNE